MGFFRDCPCVKYGNTDHLEGTWNAVSDVHRVLYYLRVGQAVAYIHFAKLCCTDDGHLRQPTDGACAGRFRTLTTSQEPKHQNLPAYKPTEALGLQHCLDP